MNLVPITHQAVGVAQMLCFLSRSTSKVAGGIVATAALDVALDFLLPALGLAGGSDDGLARSMEALGSSINAHMDELFTQLTLNLQALKMEDARDVVAALAAEIGRNQMALSQATAPGASLEDLAATVAIIMDHAKSVLSGQSPLSQVIEFCRNNATKESNYATLSLLLAAVLGQANFCQYAIAAQLMLDSRRYLAWHEAARKRAPGDPALPQVPIPSEQHGDLLYLNSSVFAELSRTLGFAVPLVVEMNNAARRRQEAADVAARTVQPRPCVPRSVPTRPKHSELRELQPSVVAPNSDLWNRYYGALSPRNAERIALLRNAQLRHEAWVEGTAAGGLCLYGPTDLLNLNYCLSNLNEAAQTFFEKLRPNAESPLRQPPAQLAGIYPCPQPYIVKTGDTLSALATRFHTTVEIIADLNGIPDPDRIGADQQLIIPGH
jgi:hypothetical protein